MGRRGSMAHVLSSDEPAQESLTGRLFFAEDPDPRVLQGVFALMCCLSGALLVAGGSTVTLRLLARPRAGDPARGSAAWPRWSRGDRAPTWALWVLPLADMAAARHGAARATASNGIGILVVVPAIWLGPAVRPPRRRGLRPGRRRPGRGPEPGLLRRQRRRSWPGLVVIPLVAAWAAAAVAAGIEGIERGRARGRAARASGWPRRSRSSSTSGSSPRRSSTPSTSAWCCSTRTAATAP